MIIVIVIAHNILFKILLTFQPTLDHRFESYFNYCDLFNYILSKFTALVKQEYCRPFASVWLMTKNNYLKV